MVTVWDQVNIPHKVKIGWTLKKYTKNDTRSVRGEWQTLKFKYL